jgi:hypothetical protein
MGPLGRGPNPLAPVIDVKGSRMATFAPVRPPAWGEAAKTPEATLTSIEEWIANVPLAALVEIFGGAVPSGSTAETLEWLESFSDVWDFRAGQERNLARTADFDESTTDLILAVAGALGLTSAVPPSAGEYSHMLILGGLVRACLLRPRFAADLLRDGLRAVSVSALSAYRPLRGDENELIEVLGQSGKQNEADVMEAGLVEAFGLGDPVDEQLGGGDRTEFGGSLVRTWSHDNQEIRLVIAPSPAPESRRANTADTYEYWADRCVHLGPSDSILLVTSSIYVPYQHADAVRMLALPHGCSVETVGIDFSDESLGALRQPFTPANYLQEVRSTIRSVRLLHSAASEAAMSPPGAVRRS